MLILLALAGPTRAVDVSQLSDFENDPCVIGLAERNAAQKIGAPDSALSDACERAHGRIDVGWDIILRTWKPPDVSQIATATARAGTLASLLGLLGMVLVTAALGWPVRPIHAALRTVPVLRRLLAAAALALAGRIVVAVTALATLTLPYAPLLASIVLLWRMVRRPRALAASNETGASASAEILAVAINDVAGNLFCLLGLALFARGNLALLVLGVLLAAFLSGPRPAQLWRRLRGTTGVCAAAAGLAGVAAAADPAVARMVAARLPALALLLPLAYAAIVLWRRGVAGQLREVRLRRPGQVPPQIPGV